MRQRAFAVFWLGEAVSVVGDQFFVVALPLLMFRLTPSPAALGAVLMTSAVPRALFSPLGGTLIDRHSPEIVLLASNIVRALALTAGLALGSELRLWQLFVLAAVLGTATAFSYPALMSMPPRLVDDAELERANARVFGTARLASVFGPALAGVAIAQVGLSFALLLDVLSFVVSIATLLWVRRLVCRARDPSQVRVSPAGAPGGFTAVLHYASVDPVVRTVLALSAAVSFGVIGPTTVGLPMLALQALGSAPGQLGSTYSLFGGGVLTGTLIAAKLRRPVRAGHVSAWVAALMAGGMFATCAALSLRAAHGLVYLALFGVGAALGYLNLLGTSWLQAYVPAALRGRMMALMFLVSTGVLPIAYALSGWIAQLGVAVLFGAGGVAVMCAQLPAQAEAFRNATWRPASEPDVLDAPGPRQAAPSS